MGDVMITGVNLQMNIELILNFICVVLSFIFAISAVPNFVDDDKKIKNIKTIISIFFIGLCTFSFVLLILGPIKVSKMPWQIEELTATEYIIAFQDSHDLNGKMYFRRGYISDELWFHYYVDVGDGFVANKIKSNTTTLYYTDDNYRVEWYKYTKKWLWFEVQGVRQKAYIPEGSIVEEFSLDLE